jgi:hypothetical protein
MVLVLGGGVFVPFACGGGSTTTVSEPRHPPSPPSSNVPAAAPTTQSSSEYAAHRTAAPPGYIGVVDGHHGNNFVGFMKRTDMDQRSPDHDAPIPVYDRDLRTVTGHMYANKGFVPVATDPADVPDFPTTTFTTTSTRPAGP